MFSFIISQVSCNACCNLISISLCLLFLTDAITGYTHICEGNGKIKTKEPMEMANKAISQLKEALEVAKSS